MSLDVIELLKYERLHKDTRELPGVALVNISNGQIITGYNNAFVHSVMSSYARLQSLNSDSDQTTGQISLKLTRVTPTGLEGFEELSTAYKFLVSEAPSRKNLKTKDSHIS